MKSPLTWSAQSRRWRKTIHSTATLPNTQKPNLLQQVPIQTLTYRAQCCSKPWLLSILCRPGSAHHTHPISPYPALLPTDDSCQNWRHSLIIGSCPKVTLWQVWRVILHHVWNQKVQEDRRQHLRSNNHPIPEANFNLEGDAVVYCQPAWSSKPKK